MVSSSSEFCRLHPLEHAVLEEIVDLIARQERENILIPLHSVRIERIDSALQGLISGERRIAEAIGAAASWAIAPQYAP